MDQRPALYRLPVDRSGRARREPRFLRGAGSGRAVGRPGTLDEAQRRELFGGRRARVLPGPEQGAAAGRAGPRALGSRRAEVLRVRGVGAKALLWDPGFVRTQYLE